MHVRKKIQSQKAISPILATLLLIVIAVAAIVVTYAWIMTYMGAQTTQAGVLLSKDAVSWPANNSIIIYVRNVGTSDATIDAIYIGTSSTNLEKQTNIEFTPNNQIVEANGGLINITVTYTWSSDTTYYFRIAPKTGPPLEFNEKAP